MITTNNLQPKFQVHSAPLKAAPPKSEQAPAEQSDKAELSGAQECAPVKAAKSSKGFVNGLKKTAMVAALAATLGCVATPAMADCYGNYGYNRPSVAVQVDPYNGVTISQNQYNPYNGGSDHVAVTFGRGGVRVEAGHQQPWMAPPVVVMPNPCPVPVYPTYPQAPVIVVPAPMPYYPHHYHAPQVMPLPMPHHHNHSGWGWGR